MKKILILPIIILVIALSGCDQGEPTQNATTTGTAYVGGSEGLELSFLANAPPSTVFDKPEDGSLSPFDISVKIENKGEYTVLKGKYNMKISGIDPKSFGKTSISDFKVIGDVDDLVETRRSGGETIAGTFTILSIDQIAYVYPVSGQIGPFNLRSSVCYEYQTEASSTVCVLEDLLGTTGREGLCKPTESKNVENSGGPIQVRSFEESVTGKESIALTFKVQHVGGSKDLVFKNNGQNCPIGDRTEQDKVGVKVELGNTDITARCTGIDKITKLATMYGDTGAQIRCSGTLTDLGLTSGDYVQPVTVIMIYDYNEYIDQQITVKQVGT